MVLSISTNVSALTVQRNLADANQASASSLAKLSSGSRVPTAKDDAASLAIGSRVQAEIAGLQQASTNASQATSLLQIADGAYGEINDILVRQSTLAIQSSSGQLSDAERAIIDSEFQALSSEVDRIATDTEFNGNQILNGGSVTTRASELSAGNLAGNGISVELDGTDTNGIYEVTYDSSNEELTITNRGTGEVLTQDITAVLDAAAGTANANLSGAQEAKVNFADLGVEVTLNADFDRAGDIASVGSMPSATENATTLDLGDELTSSLSGLPRTDAAVTGDVLQLAVDASGLIGTTGSNLSVSVDGAAAIALDGTQSAVALAADTTYTILDADGNTVAEFTTGSTNFAQATATGTIDFDASGLTNSFVAEDNVSTTSDYSFKVGTGNQAQDDINISIDAVTTSVLGTSSASVATQAGAASAIDSVKTAIDTLQGSRAEIGASLSRLDFASSNLAVAIENQSAARSGLLDTDVAAESTNYASQQVIVQAGVSLLAQANQQPSQLLSLIG